MSNKRRVNFQSATTEAARRELMKPVPCWERVFVTAEGSSFKVPKWVKTEKQQHFSDDEDGAIDQPLAPIVDEVMEVDEENEGEDAAEPVPSAGQGTPIVLDKPTVTAEATPVPPDTTIEEIPEPDATLSLVQTTALDETAGEDVLDPALALSALDDADVVALGGVEMDLTGLGPDGLGADPLSADALSADALVVNSLDVGPLDVDPLSGLTPDDLAPDALSILPPDGTAFEGAHDLSQVGQPEDAILGGKAMDASEDPFVGLS